MSGPTRQFILGDMIKTFPGRDRAAIRTLVSKHYRFITVNCIELGWETYHMSTRMAIMYDIMQYVAYTKPRVGEFVEGHGRHCGA
jgi:hypothetical protein